MLGRPDRAILVLRHGLAFVLARGCFSCGAVDLKMPANAARQGQGGRRLWRTSSQTTDSTAEGVGIVGRGIMACHPKPDIFRVTLNVACPVRWVHTYMSLTSLPTYVSPRLVERLDVGGRA